MTASRPRLGLLAGAAALVAAVSAGAPPAGAAVAADPVDLITLTTSPDPLHVEGFAPGDRTEWTGHVTNLTDNGLALRLAMGAGDTGLTADPADGLQLTISRCSVPWTPTITAGATTFSCTGLETALTDTPVPAASVAGAGFPLGRVDPRRTADVRIRLALPFEAGNEFERLAATIAIQVEATIVDGPTPTTPATGATTTTMRSTGQTAAGPTRTATPGGPLPRTGADVASLALVGLATIGGGLALLAAARDRRRRHTLERTT